MSLKSLKLIAIFVLVLFFSLYLAFLNPYSVTFSLSKTVSFNLPIIILALISFFAGVLVLIVINLVMSSRNMIFGWMISYDKYKKQQVAFRYQRAQSLIFRGKTAQGFNLLHKVVKKDPKHVRALQKLGDMYREKGMTQKAISLHSKAVYYNNKEDIEILYSLASDHMKSNNPLEAESILKEISSIDRDSIKPLYELRAIYKKSKSFELLCETQSEILRLSRALKPDEVKKEINLLARFYLDYAYTQKEKGDLRQAKKCAKIAIKVDEKFIPAYLALGHINEEENNCCASEKVIREGFKKTNSPLFLKELERIYHKEKRINKIPDLYKKAISVDSDNPILKTMLADAYLKLDMIDESMDEVKLAEEINPNIPLLHKIKAALFEKKNDLPQATMEYKSLVENQSFHALLFPCSRCGHSVEDWNITCPECEKAISCACA